MIAILNARVVLQVRLCQIQYGTTVPGIIATTTTTVVLALLLVVRTTGYMYCACYTPSFFRLLARTLYLELSSLISPGSYSISLICVDRPFTKMASFILPTLHHWFVRQVKDSRNIVKSIQDKILVCGRPLHLDYPFQVLSKCSTQLFFTCFLLPFTYLNFGMETGRSLLLTWCIATYMANFLKDLLVVPRLSRHDPSLRLYRTILLRGVQTNSRASLPTKKKRSGSGGGGGGGRTTTTRNTTRSRSTSIWLPPSLCQYNFNDCLNGAQNVDQIEHSSGLPSTYAATSFSFVFTYLFICPLDHNNNSGFLLPCALMLLMCFTHLLNIYAGVDSPTSVGAGYVVGILAMIFSRFFESFLFDSRFQPNQFYSTVLSSDLSASLTSLLPTFASTVSFQEYSFLFFILPLSGLLSLLTYPIPHRYDSGGTYSSTARAIGYFIGSIIGYRVLHGTSLGGGSYYDLDGGNDLRVPTTPTSLCVQYQRSVVEGVDKLLSYRDIPRDIADAEFNHMVITVSKHLLEGPMCVFTSAVRGIMATSLCLGLFSLLCVVYVHLSSKHCSYRRDCGCGRPRSRNSCRKTLTCRLFRPRLNPDVRSIFAATSESEHKHLMATVEEAEAAIQYHRERERCRLAGGSSKGREKEKKEKEKEKKKKERAGGGGGGGGGGRGGQQQQQRKTSKGGKSGRKSTNKRRGQSDGSGSPTSESQSATTSSEELNFPKIADSAGREEIMDGSRYGSFERSIPFNYLIWMSMGCMVTLVVPQAVWVWSNLHLDTSGQFFTIELNFKNNQFVNSLVHFLPWLFSTKNAQQAGSAGWLVDT